MRIWKVLRGFCGGVDFLNEWMAKIFAWLIIPLTFIVALDVFLRYVLNRPTDWAWDVNVQLLGGLIVLGAGYTLLREAHIGVDVFLVRFSPKKRAVVELITFALFILTVGVLLWKTTLAALVSVQTGERYASYWMPPIYPLKVAMFVGVLLFWLQGIAKFLRTLFIFKSGKTGEEV